METVQIELPLMNHRKSRPESSATIELAQRARIMKSEGRDIIELAGGDPDFTCDRHVQDAITESVRRGETKYTHPRGIPRLRQAISKKLKSENSIDANPDEEILVTAGGKESIAITLMALLEHSDEVLIPAPYWVSFNNMVVIAGGKPVSVVGDKSNGFKITTSDLNRAFSNRSRFLILNNPHNPTGQFYSESEIRQIADWCVNMGVYLISDEVYEHILFDDHVMFSPSSDAGYKNFTITVNSVSKTHAMTGLRVGWLSAPNWLVEKIEPYHQHLITCAPSICQHGALAAIENSSESVEDRRKIYSKRRDLVFENLSKSKTIKPLKPSGTFYMFLDISQTGLPSVNFCATLLEETGLALCPGSAFSDAGEGWVRMLFAREEGILRDACGRITGIFG
jgi:aspartate/methionine/tyrosine aminotransferase